MEGGGLDSKCVWMWMCVCVEIEIRRKDGLEESIATVMMKHIYDLWDDWGNRGM